jgi:hypothetical protein
MKRDGPFYPGPVPRLNGLLGFSGHVAVNAGGGRAELLERYPQFALDIERLTRL